jgi:cytochrome c oxidase cbb3-type subunit 3
MLMRNRIWMSVTFLAALGAASCGNYEPATGAAAGSAPLNVSDNGAVTDLDAIPVGPMPGPRVETNLPQNPFGQDPVAITEGRELFLKYNCYGCHGGRGGGGMGPNLRGPAYLFGGDPAHLFSSITEGRGMGMPSWGTMIPQDQIWKLVSYLKSMGTPREPDAPRNEPEKLPKS